MQPFPAWSRDVHEYSLARAILETAADIGRQRQLGPIQQVTIELGEFSGVEPLQLQAAFVELSTERWGHPAELDVHTVPLWGRCRGCQAEFAILDFCFQCPHCQQGDVEVIRGEELQLIALRTASEEPIP